MPGRNTGGTDFMSIYCWLHVCISWYSEEKRTIQNFIRLYCSFSCCVFLSGDCLYYTEMYRTVGLLESIMDSSGSAAYSLCRNLPDKKVGASRPRQYILLIFIAAVLAFCGTGLNRDGFTKGSECTEDSWWGSKHLQSDQWAEGRKWRNLPGNRWQNSFLCESLWSVYQNALRKRR